MAGELPRVDPVIDPADERLAEGLRRILAEQAGRDLCGYTPWAFNNRLDRRWVVDVTDG